MDKKKRDQKPKKCTYGTHNLERLSLRYKKKVLNFIYVLIFYFCQNTAGLDILKWLNKILKYVPSDFLWHIKT